MGSGGGLQGRQEVHGLPQSLEGWHAACKVDGG